MTKKDSGKSDKVWDAIFNIVGMVFAFAGFIAVLFVGVFLAAASVYMFFKSMSFEGAKIAAGIFFSLFMLGVSATAAYCAIFIIKAVSNRYIVAPADIDNCVQSKSEEQADGDK